MKKNYLPGYTVVMRMTAMVLSLLLLSIWINVPVNAENITTVDEGENYIEIVESENESIAYIHNREIQTIDAIRFIQQVDGTKVAYGWYNVSKESLLDNDRADFTMETINNNVVLTRNSEQSVVIATLIAQNDEDALSSFNLHRDADWYKQVLYTGNVKTELLTATEVLALLGEITGSIKLQGLGTIANFIVDNAVPSIYFKQCLYSNILDACRQEYYYSYEWYSDGAYNNLIGVSNTGKTTVNLCRGL